MALDGDDTSSTVYLDDLNPVNPAGDTNKSDGDDHLRFIKRAIKNTFPNITGIVTPTQTELNRVDGVLSQLAGIDDTATLTNKTLTSPTINGGTLANTFTFTGEITAGAVTISPTELSYLNNLAENVQTALDAKVPKAGTDAMSGDIDFNNNDIAGIKTATFEAVYSVTTPGATPTFDWNNGLRQKTTLSANVTSITFTAPPGPSNLILVITPNTYSVTGWPAAVDWGAQGAPTMADGERFVCMFYYDGTTYFASYLQGFAE